MSLGTENGGVPAVMNVTPTGSTGYNNGGGWGGDWGAWIILFLIFGMFGWGGFGGFGGGWGNGGGQGALTRSDLCSEFNFNGLENSVRGIQQGICDSTYALNTSILNGFHGVDNAVCNLGYQTQQGFNATQVAMMQGFNAAQAQAAECCCQTQRAIDGVNYNLATQGCDTRNTIQNSTRDIIDSQNSGFRAILDKMCQQELAAKDAQIAAQNQRIFGLELSASQSAQNATLMAAMDANKADILRRTGAECPTPAYVVQPPTPVNFPTNCCGQFNGWNNGCGCNSGCGC